MTRSIDSVHLFQIPAGCILVPRLPLPWPFLPVLPVLPVLPAASPRPEDELQRDKQHAVTISGAVAGAGQQRRRGPGRGARMAGALKLSFPSRRQTGGRLEASSSDEDDSAAEAAAHDVDVAAPAGRGGSAAADIPVPDFTDGPRLHAHTKEGCCQHNAVSLFWEEKLLIFVDFMQVPHPPPFPACSCPLRSSRPPSALLTLARSGLQHFALIRAASTYWPWPPFWRKWTRVMLLFMLDVPAFVHRDPDDLDMAESGPVTTSWGVFVFIWFLGLLLLLGATAKALRPNFRPSRLDRLVSMRLCINFGELLYLPAALALPRIVGCDQLGDPDIYPGPYGTPIFDGLPECGGAAHVAVVCLAVMICGPFIIGLPVLLWHTTRRQLVYTEDVAHEIYLKAREMEYLLGLNDVWKTSHMYVFSSFRRVSAYAKTFMALRKLLLAATVFGSPVVQATAILGTISVTQLMMLIWPCYRCSSSRSISQAMGWTLICNIGSGWLKALGIRSFFLVDSNLQYEMIFMNGLGIAIALHQASVAVYAARQHKPTVVASSKIGSAWPGLPPHTATGPPPHCHRTATALAIAVPFRQRVVANEAMAHLNARPLPYSSLSRTVTLGDAALVQRDQKVWVEACAQASALIHGTKDRLPLFVDPVPLGESIKLLESYVEQAGAAGSLLWVTMDELLHESVIIYNSIEKRTLLPNPVPPPPPTVPSSRLSASTLT